MTGVARSSREVRLALLRAQSSAFTRQVPLLYSILCVDAATLSYTHIGKAPWQLSILVPGLLIAGCLLRMLVWLKRQSADMSLEAVTRQFAVTTLLAPVLGLLFISWTFSLYPYGDAAMRGQVAATFAITATCNIYCLLHYPAASLILAAFTVPLFTGFLSLTGSPTLMAFGVDLFIVALCMCYMVLRSAQDFAQMIAAQAATMRLSDENSRLANSDMLTELPNRRQFFDQLEAAYSRHKNAGRFYVGAIDLDGFKPVNDIFGHIVGDRLLVECASRFAALAQGDACRRRGFFVARLGGDEFGLIIETDDDDNDMIDLGRAICARLKEPFALEGVVATISASVGFAAFPDAGATPAQLYERADYALYFAKQHHRGDVVMFTPEHEKQMKGVAIIEQALRCADLDTELSLAFQPLLEIDSRRVIAFEALARWSSPELGQVSPDQFIAVAERSDLINRLTRTLLRKALAAAAQWPAEMRLSFNLSCRDLISPAAITQIIAIVEQSGVAPRRIDFEVTETALLPDFARATESLLALKRIGARISLDDFGAGYSSLNYVHRLPLDKIKIDRSFVQEMETNKSSRDIVKTMIAMCGNLHLDCVTEGIETEEQLAMLKSVGGTMAQGYLFGKPIAPEDVARFLEISQGPSEAAAHKVA